MAASGSILGNAVLRLEDPTLLTGEGKYVDDLVEPGMLHVAFVRSTEAHANLLSVDISEASSMPGVVAVYHAGGDDLGLPSLQQFPMMPETLNRPVFATGKVRFVGDVVAAVVAETRAQAADAAEAVVVDYEPLPAVVTAVDALAPDAPLLFAEHGSNVCFGTTFPPEGDADPLDGADVVAEVTMVSQRLAGVPMETNGILAVPADGGLTCWVSPPGAPLDPRRLRADARPRSGPAARRLPVGGRRLRPQGGPLRRAPGRRRGRAEARPAGEVDRDALGGHGVAGARPRLRDDGQARRDARRQDRRPRRLGGGVGGRLPGARRHPADAHPDDVGRRVRRSRTCGSRPRRR